MQLTTNNVNKILVGIMKAGAGIDNVIVETRNGPRPPAGPYGTIYWASVMPLKNYNGDSVYTDSVEADLSETRITPAYCNVQLSIFGDGSFDKCINLASWIQSNNIQFETAGIIGLSNTEAVNDISTTVGGIIEQRASMYISFYCEFNREYNIDYFTIDNITIKFHGDGSVEPININNEVI